MNRLLILMVLICGTTFAEKNISVAGFLSDPNELADIKDNSSLELQKKKIDYIQSSKPNTPFIKNVQLRYKMDDWTMEEHDFKLRVSPRAWGETSNGKKLYESSLEYQQDKVNLLSNSVLRKRYKLVSKMVHYRRDLELDSNLLAVYQDKVKIQKDNIGSIDFNIEVLITDEDYITTIKLRLIDINKQIADLKKRAGVPEEAHFDFDTTNYITAVYINDLMKEEQFDIDTTNIFLNYSNLKYEYAKSKYDLEVASSRNIVSYVDVGYTYDRDPGKVDYWEEHFTAGIGVNIPIINSKRLSIDSKKIALLKVKGDYYETKQSLEESITDIKRDIKIYSSQLEMLLQRKKEVAKESYLKSMVNIQGVSPFKLLNIKESIIRTDKKIEDISFAMSKKYIELLDVSGKMSEKPLRNYLSTQQELMVE